MKRTFEHTKTQLNQCEHRVILCHFARHFTFDLFLQAESFRIQLTKAEQENDVNQKKVDELEERLNNKEREYLSKRLTFEVYEDQLKRMLQAAEEMADGLDNHVSIERFQQEIKQFSKELPKLKSQIDAIQGRIAFFQQRKNELLLMRDEYKKLEYDVQLALEEKILKENEFNRLITCRETIRNIYKCRSTNDLPQKIFYALPVRSKHTGETEEGMTDEEEEECCSSILVFSFVH